VVPFGVVVPPEDRDPQLPETLLLHADAILWWAVAGYRDWQARGMCEPPSVLAATGAYQSESDAVARFVSEACMASPAASATTRELYAAWQRWAIADGAEALTEKAFGKELDRLGHEAKRTKVGMVRHGLTPYADDSTLGGEGW
jgi:putative DNA primase/helicase